MSYSASAVTLADIGQGRVLLVSPLDLGKAEVGGFTGVNPLGGNSPHYFMCVAVDSNGKSSYWCPLSSKQKPEGIGTHDMQGFINPDAKMGFAHFKDKKSWFDAGQVWKVDNATIINAALKDYCNRRAGDTFNMVSTLLIQKFFPGSQSL